MTSSMAHSPLQELSTDFGSHIFFEVRTLLEKEMTCLDQILLCALILQPR